MMTAAPHGLLLLLAAGFLPLAPQGAAAATLQLLTPVEAVVSPTAAQEEQPATPPPAARAPQIAGPTASWLEDNPHDRTGTVTDAFRGPISTTGADLIRDRWFVEGVVNLPDAKSGVLMQGQGRVWRRWHNEPILYWGGWIILGMALLLFLFTTFRGRIPLRQGFSGHTIERFGGLERANHWMTAGSFILVALTGLVILYGQHLIKPLTGATAFSTIATWSAYIHMAFVVPFVIGVAVMVIAWLGRNIPTGVDWQWIKRGGGFLEHGPHHASSDKFNAGQKAIFWAVFLGAIVLLVTGIALMFPFFWLGIGGMQWAQSIHAIVGLLLIAVMIGHIWIGTIGMVGAFDAMWDGQVDRNWAEEHHDLWVRELEDRAPARGAGAGR